MFDSVGWGEILVVLVVALFVFGPDRLPGVAAEAGRGLRRLRLFLKGMTEDLKSELGPEFGDVDLASLNPKTFVQKHLLADDDDDVKPVVPLGGVTAQAKVPEQMPLPPGQPAPWDPDAT